MNITVPTTHFTDHICRACARKLSHVENKLNELKIKFLSTQQKLESSHGKTSKKRLLNQSEAGSKKPYFQLRKSVKEMTVKEMTDSLAGPHTHW